jgi:hypothetical protein
MARVAFDNLLLPLAQGDPAAVDWIIRAARVVVATRGDMGLEEAASLARTPLGRRRGLRDAYLRQAALIVGGGRLAGPKEMHALLRQFAGGLWKDWQGRREAPSYASDLEVALFNAFRAGDVPTTPQGVGGALSGN